MGKTIIVTGAAGWIGREVAAQATSRGLEVIALDAAPASDGPWIVYQVADIATDGVLSLAAEPALEGAIGIIHCAGYAHRLIETDEEIERFQSINRDGTGRVLELARRINVGRIVYLSSIAFYDWRLGCDFHEDGPLDSPTAYAESKLAGERLCRESGLDWRVARLGTVFGTGDRANFAKLSRALARSRFVVPAQGLARKSVLPVSLAAELLVDMALRDNLAHRLVNLALPIAPTLATICDTYSRECAFPRARRVPLRLLRLMAVIGDRVAQLRPNFPLTSVNLRKLTTSTTVNTGRMMAAWPDRRWETFEYWLAQSAEFYRRQAGLDSVRA